MSSIREELEYAQEQTIPPLSFEIVLASGTTYYAKWIFRVDPTSEIAVVRIWDMRLNVRPVWTMITSFAGWR